MTMDEHQLIAGMRSLLAAYDGQQAAQQIGDAFLKAGLRQTLNATFAERPILASGKATQLAKGATPPGLDHPGFQWRAGLLNAKLGYGLNKNAWRPGKPYPGFTSIPNNNEAEIYLNQDAIDRSGVDPISSDGANLILTAAPITPELRTAAGVDDQIQYTSGAIISYPFSQCYGIFEMEAQFPVGPGLWPAFWLLRADQVWPPEIDVVEALMRDVATAYTTVHFRKPDGGKTARGQPDSVRNMSQGFHRYALNWTREKLQWAIDGETRFEVPTPPDLIDVPCYLVANLAVGGIDSWPGPPNELTQFPAQMKIRSIEAWSF